MDNSVGDTWRGAGSIPDFFPQDTQELLSKDATGMVHPLKTNLNQMNSRRVVIDSLQHSFDSSRPSTLEARFSNMKRVLGVKLVEVIVPRNGGVATLTLRATHTNGQNSDLIVHVNSDASLHDIGLILQSYNEVNINQVVVNSMNTNSGTLWASESYVITSLPNGFMVTVRDGSSSVNLESVVAMGDWPSHQIFQYTQNGEKVFIFAQTSRSAGKNGCPYLCVEGMGILEFPVNGGTLASNQVPRDAFCLLINDNDNQKPIVSSRSPAKWFKNPLSNLDRLTISLKKSDGSAFIIDDDDRIICIFDIICE